MFNLFKKKYTYVFRRYNRKDWDTVHELINWCFANFGIENKNRWYIKVRPSKMVSYEGSYHFVFLREEDYILFKLSCL